MCPCPPLSLRKWASDGLMAPGSHGSGCYLGFLSCCCLSVLLCGSADGLSALITIAWDLQHLCSLLSALPPFPDGLSSEAMLKVSHTALSPSHCTASLQHAAEHDSTHTYLASSSLPLLSRPHLPLLEQKQLHFSNSILMLCIHCNPVRSHCQHNSSHYTRTNPLNKTMLRVEKAEDFN